MPILVLLIVLVPSTAVAFGKFKLPLDSNWMSRFWYSAKLGVDHSKAVVACLKVDDHIESR